MEIECPACRKINQVSHECPRCGCDLSTLWDLSECAEQELGRGAERLRDNNGLAALEHAKRSWGIKRSARAAKLAFLACILARRFDEAAVWYRRATGENRPFRKQDDSVAGAWHRQKRSWKGCEE